MMEGLIKVKFGSPYTGTEFKVGYDSTTGLEYNDFNLPLQIKETLDMSYDTASMTIPLSNEKKEYQPDTMVDILIYKPTYRFTIPTGTTGITVVVNIDNPINLTTNKLTYNRNRLSLVVTDSGTAITLQLRDKSTVIDTLSMLKADIITSGGISGYGDNSIIAVNTVLDTGVYYDEEMPNVGTYTAELITETLDKTHYMEIMEDKVETVFTPYPRGVSEDVFSTFVPFNGAVIGRMRMYFTLPTDGYTLTNLQLQVTSTDPNNYYFYLWYNGTIIDSYSYHPTDIEEGISQMSYGGYGVNGIMRYTFIVDSGYIYDFDNLPVEDIYDFSLVEGSYVRTRYTHTISFIEATRKLENIYPNNLTITQPVAKYAGGITEFGPSQPVSVSANVSTSRAPFTYSIDADYVSGINPNKVTYSMGDIILESPIKFKVTFKSRNITGSFTKTKIEYMNPDIYYISTNANLTSDDISYDNGLLFSDMVLYAGDFIRDDSRVIGLPKIKTWFDSYGNDIGHVDAIQEVFRVLVDNGFAVPSTDILQAYDGKLPLKTICDYTKEEIEGSNDDIQLLELGELPASRVLSLNTLLLEPIIPPGASSALPPVLVDGEQFYIYAFKMISDPELVVNQITFHSKYASVRFGPFKYEEISETIKDGTQRYKISSTIEKILNQTSTVQYELKQVPTVVDSTYTSFSMVPSVKRESTSPRFKFDYGCLANTQDIDSPEYVFENKSLWEIMTEIGQTVRAIPKLIHDLDTDDELISFKVIGSGGENNTNTPILESKTLIDRNSTINLNNYFSEYAWDGKNVIKDHFQKQDNFVWYPGYNEFIGLRSKNYNEATVKMEDAALVLPPTIKLYKNFQLLCSYTYKNVTYTTDITDYVFLKEIWNALPSTLTTGSDNNLKEKRLWYSKDGNTINGFGVLPQRLNVTGLDKETHRTIQYILEQCSDPRVMATTDGASQQAFFTNIWNYKFSLKYQPKIDTNLRFSESNLSGTIVQNTGPFNQTSNVLSCTQVAKMSTDTLNKIGNAELNYTYLDKFINSDFILGAKVDFDDIISSTETIVRYYYINSILSTYYINHKEVTLNLTKDNYKIDGRVDLNKEYRQYSLADSATLNKTVRKNYYGYVCTAANQADNGGIEYNRLKGVTAGYYSGYSAPASYSLTTAYPEQPLLWSIAYTFKPTLTIGGSTNPLKPAKFMYIDLFGKKYDNRLISTNGTVGNITGTGPWYARITGMQNVTGLSVGDEIAFTAGSGTCGTGIITMESNYSTTAINIKCTGGTTPVAGTITAISRKNVVGVQEYDRLSYYTENKVNSSVLVKPIMLPVIGFAFDNSLHLVAEMYDNMSAGTSISMSQDNYTLFATETTGDDVSISTALTYKRANQNDVRYVDSWGEAELARIRVIFGLPGETSSGSTYINPSKLPEIETSYALISTTGTVGSITGSSPTWTATITNMQSTSKLKSGDLIVATDGSGKLGVGGTYTVVSILTDSSITYTASGGTTPVAGTITTIKENNPKLGYLPLNTSATKTMSNAETWFRTFDVNSNGKLLSDSTILIQKDNREKLKFDVSMTMQTFDKDIEIWQGLMKYNINNSYIYNNLIQDAAGNWVTVERGDTTDTPKIMLYNDYNLQDNDTIYGCTAAKTTSGGVRVDCAISVIQMTQDIGGYDYPMGDFILGVPWDNRTYGVPGDADYYDGSKNYDGVAIAYGGTNTQYGELLLTYKKKILPETYGTFWFNFLISDTQISKITNIV